MESLGGRLILLPERPGERSGYQKAVHADLNRLCPTTKDVVCCYATESATGPDKDSFSADNPFIIIPRPKRYAPSRVLNLLQGRVSGELRLADAKKNIPNRTYSQVFCGEVTLYRALRKLYTGVPMQVRFHNFFFVSTVRNQFLRYSLQPATQLNFYLLGRLEREILRDKLVTPIFITEEEYRFFRIIYPRREAYIWDVAPAAGGTRHVTRLPDQPRLVWFGGLSSHKKYSLQYFINQVYLPLCKATPQIELHLFGAGTASFHSPQNRIFGHGYYQGEGYPFGGNALFINPDLLGGGVKLKVADWIRDGIAFISTPFGVEGYTLDDHTTVFVREIEEWPHTIMHFFYETNAITKAQSPK